MLPRTVFKLTLVLTGILAGASTGLPVGAPLGAGVASLVIFSWTLLEPLRDRFRRGVIRGESRRLPMIAKLALVGGAIALALAWAWEVTAWKRGELQARFDVDRGIFRIKRTGFGAGPCSPAHFTRRDFLKHHHGIHLDAEAGCRVTRAILEYVDGYNSVSEPVIREKFGVEVFVRGLQEIPVLFASDLIRKGLSGFEGADPESLREVIEETSSYLCKRNAPLPGESSRFIPDLLDLLEAESPEVRQWALGWLGMFGQAASSTLPALKALEEDSDARVREAARMAIESILDEVS